jgi:ABC-type antimicrobial peptide transport system permease subunit
LLFEAVADVHPAVVAGTPGTLSGRTSLAALPQMVGARLIGSLALIALLLSGIGLYGVISFNVTRRTREIGIRVALGASARSVMRTLVAQTAWVVVPATLLGAILATAAARGVAAFLVGVQPWDPVTLATVSVLLVVVAGIATLFPTLRAIRVEPSEALRNE